MTDDSLHAGATVLPFRRPRWYVATLEHPRPCGHQGEDSVALDTWLDTPGATIPWVRDQVANLLGVDGSKAILEPGAGDLYFPVLGDVPDDPRIFAGPFDSFEQARKTLQAGTVAGEPAS